MGFVHNLTHRNIAFGDIKKGVSLRINSQSYVKEMCFFLIAFSQNKNYVSMCLNNLHRIWDLVPKLRD
jgi:hypothetical protein